MTGLDGDSQGSQASDPTPQKGGSLKLLGEDSSTCSNEGFDSQVGRPVSSRLVTEILEQCGPVVRWEASFISIRKGLEGL